MVGGVLPEADARELADRFGVSVRTIAHDVAFHRKASGGASVHVLPKPARQQEPAEPTKWDGMALSDLSHVDLLRWAIDKAQRAVESADPTSTAYTQALREIRACGMELRDARREAGQNNDERSIADIEAALQAAADRLPANLRKKLLG